MRHGVEISRNFLYNIDINRKDAKIACPPELDLMMLYTFNCRVRYFIGVYIDFSNFRNDDFRWRETKNDYRF